jgi:hypothetical protein
MRLARLVAAGLVLGVFIGFVAALVRPRGKDPVPGYRPPLDRRPEPQHHQDAGHRASASKQLGPHGAGAELPTRPLSLPITALSGTGGSR